MTKYTPRREIHHITRLPFNHRASIDATRFRRLAPPPRPLSVRFFTRRRCLRTSPRSPWRTPRASPHPKHHLRPPRASSVLEDSAARAPPPPPPSAPSSASPLQRRRDEERVRLPPYAATTCAPTGRPESTPSPTGTETAGTPASDAATVIASAAYASAIDERGGFDERSRESEERYSESNPPSGCSSGSSTPGATVGAVGVRRTSTPGSRCDRVPPKPPCEPPNPNPAERFAPRTVFDEAPPESEYSGFAAPGGSPPAKTRSKSRDTSLRTRAAFSKYRDATSVPKTYDPTRIRRRVSAPKCAARYSETAFA